MQSVGYLQGYLPFKAGFFYLGLARLYHSFRQIGAVDFRHRQTPCQSYGEIGGACSEVEYAYGGVLRRRFHGFTPPGAVDAERHGAVHEIVGRRD